MIHRVLLLKVKEGIPSTAVAELEDKLRRLAHEVPEIKMCTLGRDIVARGWTHGLEQDFEDIAGLEAYNRNTYHVKEVTPFVRSVVDATALAYYEVRRSGVQRKDRKGMLKRILLIGTKEGTAQAQAQELEDKLALMPRHIQGIRNWSLGRNLHPNSPWTFSWEQDFDSEDGLREYMTSPFHWCVVDPLFNMEDPRCIVARHAIAVYWIQEVHTKEQRPMKAAPR